MTWRTPWALPGHWFRGALHVHTTQSDGALDPAAAVAWYREHGYHFAAITDHGAATEVTDLGDDSFLVLPGIELNTGSTELGTNYHIVGLGTSGEPSLEPETSAQAAIDAIREAGGEAVIAHPYWSGMTLADLLAVDGHVGIEVYNSTCEEAKAKGLSAVHWDEVLARGHRVWGLAVDDAHWRSQDHGQAWVVLKARRLDRDSVLEALRQGHFYSSRGPRITGIEVRDGAVHVTCSSAAAISFLCENARGARFGATHGGSIVRAEFAPPDETTFVRVECADHHGRVAWSNPILWAQQGEPSSAWRHRVILDRAKGDES